MQPDTSAAREAIRATYERHRDVMGGLSMADLKLQAAGGVLAEEDMAGHPARDDPMWIAHARSGLSGALTACDALRAEIVSAQGEVAKLEADHA